MAHAACYSLSPVFLFSMAIEKPGVELAFRSIIVLLDPALSEQCAT